MAEDGRVWLRFPTSSAAPEDVSREAAEDFGWILDALAEGRDPLTEWALRQWSKRVPEKRQFGGDLN